MTPLACALVFVTACRGGIEATITLTDPTQKHITWMGSACSVTIASVALAAIFFSQIDADC